MPDSPTRTADGSPVSQKDATHVFESATGTATVILRPNTDRYELHDEIARGGMGIIHAARDTILDREVAIKVLRQEYATHPIMLRRFVEEAHITAQLQHPSVPPVHDLGTFPDGRPFLAMKLIKGQTLAYRLEHDRPDFAELLEICEKVCEAIAFAHNKHVIHRDLKPSNIMVGAFGEVQVMDWGLGKVLRNAESGMRIEEPEVPSTPISEVRVPESDETQAGSLLGTPAYMPPEQARGDIAATGTHSDVFALGAILCELLTNDPPYIGSIEEVRGFAIAGHLAPAVARLDACKADPELIALAKHCLRVNPAERPADATAVAESVAAYRDGVEERLRVAEVDRATAEAKAIELRKRRKTQWLLAGTVIGLVAVAGFAAWQWEKSRADATQREAEAQADATRRDAELLARQRVTEQNVTEALAKLQSLREEGWKQADDPARWRLTLVAAGASLQQAEALLQKGEPTDALRTRVVNAGRELAQDFTDLQLLADLDRIWEEGEAGNMIPILMNRGIGQKYAATFRQAGFHPVANPTEVSAAWLRQHRFRARVIQAVRNWHHVQGNATISGYLDSRRIAASVTYVGATALVGQALPFHLLTEPTFPDKLQAVLDAVTDDPFEKEWWAAVQKKDTTALDRLMGSPELDKLNARQLSSFADGLASVRGPNPWAGPHRFLARAYERFPGEFWVNFRLGAGAFGSGPKTQAADRLRHLTAAVAARPQSAFARLALGVELMEQRKDREAGLPMVRAAADLDPASAWPHLFLMFSTLEAGQIDRPAMEEAVRRDPDTAFMMVQPFFLYEVGPRTRGAAPPRAEVQSLLERLIELQPNHPGGYDLRAEHRLANHDARGALVDLRKAKALAKPSYIRLPLIQMQLNQLEAMAVWEAKLPAVLNGELKPRPQDLAQLARYVAVFERRYVLAARFAAEVVAADPTVLSADGLTASLGWAYSGVQFMAWAVQAAAGEGTDAAQLTAAERTRLRNQALAWGRNMLAQAHTTMRPVLAAHLTAGPDLASVRDPKARMLLPEDERAEWLKFWQDVRAASGKSPLREIAPAPRPAKS